MRSTFPACLQRLISPWVREPFSHKFQTIHPPSYEGSKHFPRFEESKTSPSITAHALQRHCSIWNIGTQTACKCYSKSSTLIPDLLKKLSCHGDRTRDVRSELQHFSCSSMIYHTDVCSYSLNPTDPYFIFLT